MKNEHIYSSDEILAMDDLYDIQETVCSFGSSIKYKMTDEETGYVNFVRGKYSIADYIDDNTIDGILTINDDISQAMDDDNGGAGKAAMLSDETALQKILFWVYQERE